MTDKPHDRIAELESTIESLTARVDAQSRRIDTLAEQVEGDDTETRSGGETYGPKRNQHTDFWFDGSLNRRQREVVAAIDERYESGNQLGIGAIREAIRSNTDVSNKKTVTEYARTIGSSAHFEPSGVQKWTYLGGTDIE